MGGGEPVRVLALQSGTSADGIDAALVVIESSDDGLDLEIERWGTEPWRPDERSLVLRAVHGGRLDPAEWCALQTAVGRAFARAAVRFASDADPVDVVCSHGQTVFHGVQGGAVWGTLQVGEPAWIARATGCPVVFNLRVADVAAGGLGAPLITAFDERWLAASAEETGVAVASLNLGGIANVQVVQADGSASGFDTGPANALLDAWISRATDGAETFDRDGAHARAGRVDDALLARLRAHPYFALTAPKTTGRETFTIGTVDEALDGRELPLADVCATLLELTATTVADALAGTAPDIGRVVVSGGGARNPVLMARLGEHLGVPVEPSDAWGIPADAREAVMFALLAYLSAARVPLELPGTPAGRAAVAGQWDLSAAPLPVPPTVPAALPPRRLRARTREERS